MCAGTYQDIVSLISVVSCLSSGPLVTYIARHSRVPVLKPCTTNVRILLIYCQVDRFIHVLLVLPFVCHHQSGIARSNADYPQFSRLIKGLLQDRYLVRIVVLRMKSSGLVGCFAANELIHVCRSRSLDKSLGKEKVV